MSVGRIDVAAMDARQKADLIYGRAQSDLSGRLWRAALGNDAPDVDAKPGATPTGATLDSLLAVLVARDSPAPTPAAPAPLAAPTAAPIGAAAGDLGVNARHRPSLDAAAQRTGIPAAALAAIVDAEAAKDGDGGWKLYSRNPRSSAAGLGQFLAGTWASEAERAGSWLNQTARANGWLTETGKVARAARADLLALRYDAEASINAVADYARANLDRLRRAGVAVADSVEGVAHAAYLGHHLGVGDAIRFLKDGLDPARARLLLDAQVGAASAGKRIAAVGDAAAAHRDWLLGFVGRHIRPDRFAA